MKNDLIEKTQQVLDGSHQDGIDLEEISLGKLGTTVLIGRLISQLNKVDDKSLRDVLKTMGYMIYTTSLQHKKNPRRWDDTHTQTILGLKKVLMTD